MAIPRTKESVIKQVGLLFALLSFAAAVVVAFRFDYDASGTFQLGTDLSWISAINVDYHIGIDGISLPLMVLSTFITVLAVIYSWDHWPEPHNPKAFLVLMLVLATGMAGTFVALDLILFFVFFEVVLLIVGFIIFA
jgi:NADH-quinone oxidoreductase subunit M